MVQIVKVLALISYVLVGKSLAEEDGYRYVAKSMDYQIINGRAPTTYLPARMLYNELNRPEISRPDARRTKYLILQQYCQGSNPRDGIVRMTGIPYNKGIHYIKPHNQTLLTWEIRCDEGYYCQQKYTRRFSKFWDEPGQLRHKRTFIYCKKRSEEDEHLSIRKTSGKALSKVYPNSKHALSKIGQ